MIFCRSLLVVMLILWPVHLSAFPQRSDPAPKLLAKIDFKGGGCHRELTFSSDGKKLWTNRIAAWDTTTGKVVDKSPLKKQKRYPYVFDISNEKVMFGKRSSNEAMVWELDGKPVDRAINCPGKFVAIRIFDDGKRFAILLSDPTSIYMGTFGGESADSVWNLPEEIYRGRFSKNAELLAVRINKGVKVWNIAQKKLMTTFQQERKIMSFDLSHDAKFVATGGLDNILRVFDIKKEKMVAELAGHGKGDIFLPAAIYCLAFSPNGRWVASGGHDGQVIVWDMKSFKPNYKLKIGGPPIVQSIAFSPDSKLMAVSFENAGSKHGIRVWELPGDVGVP